jgi:hypothetical protein
VAIATRMSTSERGVPRIPLVSMIGGSRDMSDSLEQIFCSGPDVCSSDRAGRNSERCPKPSAEGDALADCPPEHHQDGAHNRDATAAPGTSDRRGQEVGRSMLRRPSLRSHG